MDYYSPDSEASSSPEKHAWISEHLPTSASSATSEPASSRDFSATVELSGHTHSNGYDLQEVEDGVLIVSGNGLARKRISSWTADQIRKEWPNGQLFRHYVSRRYSNAHGYEHVENTSLGLLEVNVGAYTARTLRGIQHEFLYFQAIWAASEAMTLLGKRVSAIVENHHVDKVVGFAIGSFQDICLEDSRDASLPNIRCFMQDPMLIELDVEFLATLGIEAINDPEGFIAVDETTLVYATRAYDFIYRKLSQATWPAALICDSLQLTLTASLRNRLDFGQVLMIAPNSGFSEDEAQCVEYMFSAYEQAPCPDFVDDMDVWLQPFATMAVYWRKPYTTTTATTSATPGTKNNLVAAPPASAAPAKKRGRPRKEPPPADGKARIDAAKIETPQTRAPDKDYGYLVPAGRAEFRGRRMPWVRPDTKRKVREGSSVRTGGSADGDGRSLVGVSLGRVRA
ncbi:MAG: hypothetical protein Q9184_003890 [Pyrenodesmia sp. 2 TL-2023]